MVNTLEQHTGTECENGPPQVALSGYGVARAMRGAGGSRPPRMYKKMVQGAGKPHSLYNPKVAVTRGCPRLLGA